MTAHLAAVHALKTLVILALLVVGFRVLGKREAAQLNVYDLAMLMALANAVQNAMTGGLGALPVGLATSGVILVGAWALTRLLRGHPALERRVVGQPTLLVNQGRVLDDRLRRQHVTRAELLEACRQHGVADPAEVALAVLEVDGSISIVARPRRGGAG